MKKSALLKLLLLASAGSLLLAGCVYRERVVYREPGTEVVESGVVVAEPPPAPVVEVETVAPGPGFIWIDGFWAWHGRWVWERGHWDRPPRPGMVWVGPRYIVRGGRHVYVRGGWR